VKKNGGRGGQRDKGLPHSKRKNGEIQGAGGKKKKEVSEKKKK